MFAEPSKLTPPIVRAFARIVASAAVPVVSKSVTVPAGSVTTEEPAIAADFRTVTRF